MRLLRETSVLALCVGLASPAALAQESEGDVLVVEGHRRDYLRDDGGVATGLDLSLTETPAAISIISEDILKDQQVNNVDDALRNVAGVTKFKTGNGGEEKFSIRGFDASQSIYKDGARINNGLNASNIPSTETANIERIEVLKGPSALLYGQGQPGGVINYITKRPQAERYSNAEVIIGSYNFYKGEFDTTGAVPGTDDKIAYRLVASYEDSESFRDETTRQRLLLNPTVSWTPSEQTSLLLGFEYIDDDYTQDRGQFLDGNSVEGFFYSDRQEAEQFYGIPGFNDQTTAESKRIYGIAEHTFNDVWSVELLGSYTDNDKDLFDTNGSPTFVFVGSVPALGLIAPEGAPNENIALISPNKSESEGTTTSIRVSNTFDFTDFLGFEHQLLASFNYEDFKTTGEAFGSTDLASYNVVTREYVVPELTFFSTGSGVRGESSEYGFNVVDYITLTEQFSVLIGGRFSDFTDELNDEDETDFSIRAGLVYTPIDVLSFYASYSEGYSPNGSNGALDPEPLDPERSKTYELGAKLTLRDEQLLITAAVFDTTSENIAFVVDQFAALPVLDTFGEYTSLGGEIELVGQITDQWRIQGGYAYVETEITEGGVINPLFAIFPEGNELPGISNHNINLFTFYEIPIGAGDVGLGGGVFYQSDAFASTENNLVYDGWFQSDLAAYYKRDRWKFQINARNITNEDFRQTQAFIGSDAFAALRVGTSTPRTILGSVAVEF
ncbi:MAG: TonB-dependent siderophore receptor [Pseudomonadota bacterium]